MDEDQVPEDLRPYLKHPVVQAQAAARGGVLAKRRAPVRRGPNGRWETGCSGNPYGRPKGRTTVRKAFHRFGLEGVAKLALLADDPRLTPGERAAVLSQCIQLSYSVRAIRSDASMQRKLEQQQREAEMDAAVRHFFERASIPPAMLARMQAAACSGALYGAKARAPSGAAAPGGDPTPPSEVPTGAEARAPSSTTTPDGEPAPPSGAKAQPESETQAPPDGGGNAQPGEAPQRLFRISLPA